VAGGICDNWLLKGKNSIAADLSEMIILPDGPVCSFEQRGYLEVHVSGTRIMCFATKHLETVLKTTPKGIPDPKEVSQRAI